MKSSAANIATWLADAAARAPEALAIVLPPARRESRALNYGQLDFYCDYVARWLQAAGIKSGMRVALMVPFGLDFFAYTFALFKLGAVPVLIDPGMGVRGVGRCLADAQIEAFIGSRKALLAQFLFRWGWRTVRIKINAATLLWEFWRRRDDNRPIRHRLKIAEVDPDALAAILFTSGSTGPAKGAEYTHAMFREQVRVLRETFEITPGEVDLCTFPLFALFAPALGMTSILAPMDYSRPARANAATLVELIDKHRVTNLFGSPAVMRVFARHAEHRTIELPTLKRVISAGAPVPASLIERITRMLSRGVQVFTPYGATESLPIAVIGSDEILNETRSRTDAGAGICVGKPVGRMEVAIIAIADEPIPEWSAVPRCPAHEIGEIVVRGSVVSRGYFNRPEATALHKIVDGDTVWHRTGDVGYLDDQGRIWFCGRKAHRVVVGETTLFTIPCEAVFNTHPDVFRTALVKAGGRPVLCVELNPECSRRIPDIARELLEKGARFEHTLPIRTVLFHPSFPVDIRHNAKIFREKLAVWAEKRLRKEGAA